jgi:hypothetical protein
MRLTDNRPGRKCCVYDKPLLNRNPTAGLLTGMPPHTQTKGVMWKSDVMIKCDYSEKYGTIVVK